MKIKYLLVKKKNDFCQNIEQFKSLLSVNARMTMDENNIKVGQKEVGYKIEMHEIEEAKEIVFQLTLDAEQDKEEDQVGALESVEGVLRRINDEIGLFQINTILDEVSMYYGKKLYPLMIEVESLLREIIYLFMIKNVGSKWFKEQSPKDVKESIQKTSSKNQIKGLDPLTDALLYADFITLGNFFFSEYPLKSDYKHLVQNLKKEENRTNEKLNEMVEQYESKSNWERYFADKIIVEGLANKWDKLYEYRNKVAHTRKIAKNDYDEAKKIIDELKPAFQKCLEHLDVENIEMTEAESKAIEDVAEKTIASRIRYEYPDIADSIFLHNNYYMTAQGIIDLKNGILTKRKEDYEKTLPLTMMTLNSGESDLEKNGMTFSGNFLHDMKNGTLTVKSMSQKENHLLPESLHDKSIDKK